MKRILSLLVLFISLNTYSQDRKMPIFIMMNEASVTHYLDSLNNLSSNPYYKIKKEAADNGDLILSCEYAMNEQYLYKCLQVSVRFRYIKGTNICTRQMLTGYEEYAQDNLQFIREKFTNVSSGNWEMDYGDNGLKIHAEFKGEDKYFTLDYELGSDKNAVKKIKQKNEWIKIEDADSAYIHSKYDRMYVNDKGQNIYFIWIKNYNTNTGLGGANENYISRTLFEINCTEKEYRIIEIDIYDTEDNLRSKIPTVKKTWTKIVPNSPSDYYVNAGCNLFNESSPPK